MSLCAGREVSAGTSVSHRTQISTVAINDNANSGGAREEAGKIFNYKFALYQRASEREKERDFNLL